MMHPDPGYLYRLEVALYTTEEEDRRPLDVYRLNVGIRTLQWDNDTFTLNGKPLYLHGFGRHEDSDVS